MEGTEVRWVAALSLGIVFLSATVGAGAVVQPSAADAPTDPGRDAAGALVARQLAPAADNSITRIHVASNGSATWELRIRTRLESDGDAADYRAFQERFRENQSQYVDEFSESITGIVANARTVTGREMRATDFRASTSIQTVPRRWGVVAYEFRWVGFGATEGEWVVVGDVFEGGLYIAEEDALEISAPAGYRVEAVDPQPDEAAEGVVSWQGREDFADRRPRVVLAPAESGNDEALPWSVILGGIALVVVLAVLALGLRRYRRGTGRDDTLGKTGSSTPGGGGEPVLADEDRVVRLLEEHDGRMRQQAIVEALDWSRSKTSRVLARMADEGQVRKLQLGRENVIALPDEE